MMCAKPTIFLRFCEQHIEAEYEICLDVKDMNGDSNQKTENTEKSFRPHFPCRPRISLLNTGKNFCQSLACV